MCDSEAEKILFIMNKHERVYRGVEAQPYENVQFCTSTQGNVRK